MATVNKDFKVKHGLVVEGTTGTINGENILTESQDSQDFILDLIGGETLVKSVSNEFDVSEAGELSIDRETVDAYYDPAGAAADAQRGAELYVDGREIAITTAYQSYADTAEADAVTSANSYTDGRETAITTAYQSYADTAEADAITTANSYTDGRETAITTAYQSYADAAEADAISTAAADATNKANAAQTAAEGFATQAIANLVDSAPATLDTLNELAAALQDNPDVISDLQDIASGKADASDLTDHENASTGVHGVTGSVVGTTDTQTLTNKTITGDLTFGANGAYISSDLESPFGDLEIVATDDLRIIAEDGGDIILNASGAAYVGTAAVGNEIATQGYVDAAIAAVEVDYSTLAGNNLDWNADEDQFDVNSADVAAELDTDDIVEGETNLYFTDGRAKSSAVDLLTSATLTNITITGSGIGVDPLVITAENGVADSDTDDLTEGTTNLYFTNTRAVDALEAVVPNFTAVEVNSVAKQIAATVSAPTAASQITAYSFAKAEYRSAKFLVKTSYGSHTELSEVLITLDTSDNVAITEYAIVGTNGSSMTVTADVDGANVRLRVTPVNNDSTVTVMGTLLV
jgi:hypothetical protein